MNHDQKLWCREFTLNIFDFFSGALCVLFQLWILSAEKRKQDVKLEATLQHARHLPNNWSFRSSPAPYLCGVDKSLTAWHWGNMISYHVFYLSWIKNGNYMLNYGAYITAYIMFPIMIFAMICHISSEPCEAKWVLVVEKDTVFQHLLHSGLLQLHPLILITGRGYPDILTRRFLQKLQRIAPRLPQLYLGDFEAWCCWEWSEKSKGVPLYFHSVTIENIYHRYP